MAQCIVIGPVCLCVGLWVCYHDNSKLCASIFTVGEGSDRLQLIKFWLSCAPRKGVCGGAKIFGSALLQPVRSVCISERFSFSSVLWDHWFGILKGIWPVKTWMLVCWWFDRSFTCYKSFGYHHCHLHHLLL